MRKIWDWITSKHVDEEARKRLRAIVSECKYFAQPSNQCDHCLLRHTCALVRDKA